MEQYAVRSDRRFVFDATPARVWSQIERVGEYRAWWPWLESFDGRAFARGEVWRCVVRPPLPYSLRFSVTLTDVEPVARVDAVVEGDIVGRAALTVGPSGEGTELRLVSSLLPRSSMLRAVARVARPLVEFGHGWVIDTGSRQFRTHVGRAGSSGRITG